MKKAAVVIPLYKPNLSDSEIFSVERALSLMKNWDIYFIGSLKIKDWIHSISAKYSYFPKVKLFENTYFDSIGGYNRLMLSRKFYNEFDDYEYILLAQTDSLILSDELSDWCKKGYSYIGAPWFTGFESINKNNLTFYGAGNGGFSLRKIKDFKHILSRPRHIPKKYNSAKYSFLKKIAIIFDRYIFAYNRYPFYPRIHEDIFWGDLVPGLFPSFSVPTPEIAAQFSFEVEPKYLYEYTGRKLPFGCHAWEKYDPDFWYQVLKMENKPCSQQ